MSNKAERFKDMSRKASIAFQLASGIQYVECTIVLNAATETVDICVQNTKTI